MSDKKQFTPRDLAVKILENVYEQIKKSEVLAKSKNTAHEIDNGEEPKNDEAECPESLEAADFSGESSKEENKNPKKKKKQESKESPEAESEESSESESESEEQEEESFEKAEGDKVNPSFDREKKDVEWTKPQTTMINATKPGNIKSNRGDQKKYVEEAKQRRSKFKEQGLLKSKDEKKSEDKKKEDQPLQDCGAPMDKSSHNKVEETKGIDLDKKKKADKDMENFKRPLEKCGDVEKVGKSDTCGIKKSEKGVEKLKKFLGK